MLLQGPKAVIVTSKGVPETAVGAAVIKKRLAGARRRPILLPAFSVNQRLPSEPVVILRGWLFDVGRSYSASRTPSVPICPIRFPLYSANQRFASGPAVMA